MNGMPSENVDELDRRLTALEEEFAGLRKNVNKTFIETRDVINAHKKRVEADRKSNAKND